MSPLFSASTSSGAGNTDDAYTMLCLLPQTQPVKSWFALNTKLDLRSGGSYTLASTQTPFWFRCFRARARACRLVGCLFSQLPFAAAFAE